MHQSISGPYARRPVSGFTLIVIMALYTGFAIPVSIIAMGEDFIIGLAFAAFLAWQWGRLPAMLTGFASDIGFEDVAPKMPKASKKKKQDRSSGNASFDAYREELLARLEREQSSFEGFVERLRAAKDAKEFDAYMEARADEAKTRRSADIVEQPA